MQKPRNVVVTGANRGLGLAFARHYLEAGDRVVATARDLDEADALQALAERFPKLATLVRLDVAEGHSVEAFLGCVPFDDIHLLLNNAGVYGAAESDLAAVEFDAVVDTFVVNAVGPLRVTQGLWPKFADGARIVHVTSKMGSIADNSSGGRYSYRMSKAALNMAVRNLGHECAERGLITVAIHPGWVRTDMGGSAAPLSIEDAVGAMTATIDRLTAAHNGTFVDKDGAPLPW